MHPRTWLPGLLAAALLAGCGAVRDPAPEDVDLTLHASPGDVVEGDVVLEDDWCCDGYDTDYWEWEEHVRDLPAGFEYRTLDVEDGHDWLAFTYELWIDPWVAPGDYRFRVWYEFWPVGEIFRDEYEVDFLVHVDWWRYEPYRLVVRQVAPRTGEPTLVVTEVDLSE